VGQFSEVCDALWTVLYEGIEGSGAPNRETIVSHFHDQTETIARWIVGSERARTYEAENKRPMARKDLERILAENAGYEGVRERLSELA
jgi:hypothetical protein